MAKRKPPRSNRDSINWTKTVRRNFRVKIAFARFTSVGEDRFDLSTCTYENTWWTTANPSRADLRKIRDAISEFLAEGPS